MVGCSCQLPREREGGREGERERGNTVKRRNVHVPQQHTENGLLGWRDGQGKPGDAWQTRNRGWNKPQGVSGPLKTSSPRTCRHRQSLHHNRVRRAHACTHQVCRKGNPAKHTQPHICSVLRCTYALPKTSQTATTARNLTHTHDRCLLQYGGLPQPAAEVSAELTRDAQAGNRRRRAQDAQLSHASRAVDTKHNMPALLNATGTGRAGSSSITAAAAVPSATPRVHCASHTRPLLHAQALALGSLSRLLPQHLRGHTG